MTDENKYTADQWDIVKKINRKKDYYDILGVQKDCSEDDLKKAYKRLALKLHPDKNHAPGATEAFKSVSKAFSSLSDPQEKKNYDTDGWADDGASPFYGTPFTYDGYRFNAEDLFADEVFNLFFDQNTTNFRYRQNSTRNPRKKSRPATQQQQQQQEYPRRQRQQFRDRNRHQNESTFLNSYNFLVQMSPLLLMILLSVMNTLFTYDDAYSLKQSTKYSKSRQTGRLNVEYFIRDDFKEKYDGHLANIERQVEDAHIVGLRNDCNREKNTKETTLWKAKMYNNRVLYDQTKDKKLIACEKLQSLISNY